MSLTANGLSKTIETKFFSFQTRIRVTLGYSSYCCSQTEKFSTTWLESSDKSNISPSPKHVQPELETLYFTIFCKDKTTKESQSQITTSQLCAFVSSGN